MADLGYWFLGGVEGGEADWFIASCSDEDVLAEPVLVLVKLLVEVLEALFVCFGCGGDVLVALLEESGYEAGMEGLFVVEVDHFLASMSFRPLILRLRILRSLVISFSLC